MMHIIFCVLLLPATWGKTYNFDGFVITTPLKFNYVAPFSCNYQSCDDEGSYYVPAALELAIQKLNNDSSVEYFQDLRIRYVDSSNRRSAEVADKLLYEEDITGVMGLSQDCFLEATILSISDKLSTIDACNVDPVNFKGIDRRFVSFTPTPISIAKGITRFIEEQGWSNVGVVARSTITDQFYSNVRASMIENMSNRGINVVLDSRVSSADRDTLRAQVKTDMEKARIFVIYDPSAKASLFRLYYQLMIETKLMEEGDYFVIAFLPYGNNQGWLNSPTSTIYDTKFGTDDDWFLNESESYLKNIYKNLVILSDAPVPTYASEDWQKFQQQVKKMTKEDDMCEPLCPANNTDNSIIPKEAWQRVQRAYDSLMLYAVAGENALSLAANINDDSTYFAYMLNRQYQSISGYEELIDGDGDLIGALQLYYFFEKNSDYNLWSTGRIRQTSLLLSDWWIEYYDDPLEIDWITTKPLDVPECGFNGEKCMSEADKILIFILCGAIVAGLILMAAAALLFRRYRFERRLHSLAFLIERKDITLKKHINLLSNSTKQMASVYGSVYASQAAMNNSHFILQDYEQPPERDNDSMLSVLASGPLKPGQDPESARWNNVTDFSIGIWQGAQVGLKRIYKNDVDFSRDLRMEIIALQESPHENLLGFLGMVVHSPDVFVVNELATRGSIKDILDNDELPLDDLFLNQMARDIVAGLEFLHSSPIGCHGRLKSTNCLIDSRWMVRLSSFGLRQLRGDEAPLIENDVQEGREDLWTSPELLRWSTGLGQCSAVIVQKADIYSLAILLYEIFGRVGPWGDEPMEPRDIVRRVKNMNVDKKPFRPNLAVLKDVPHEVQVTVAAAWAEEPELRPSISQIRKKLRVLTVGLKKTIMDNMVSMIEKYTSKLEKDITERNKELAKEKAKSEQLLKMMLPPIVADSLKQGNQVSAESFDCVTVFFSDCVGFVKMSASSKPIEIVQFLNDLYTCFDSIINKYDVYKVETIADAYMVVSGLPIPNGPHHAGEIASLGLALLSAIKTFKIHHRPDEKVNLRIGMHSGPCVAGVVGLKMPRYCLFGDTVNTASRMESNGIPLKINCSASSHEILVRLGGYTTEERGMVEMKGKSLQMTYFVTGEDINKRRERISREKVKYRTLRNTVGGEERVIQLE
ncbi:unnamed protein product [Auanema sp. JU1783]|nr:unnamed protein product [Auanema sp. JU1783]